MAGWHSNATAKTLVSLQDRGQLIHDIANSTSLASFIVTVLREIELVADRVRTMVSSRHLDHRVLIADSRHIQMAVKCCHLVHLSIVFLVELGHNLHDLIWRSSWLALLLWGLLLQT